MILDYLLQFHLNDCLNILSDKDNLGYFSIKIDFLKLFEAHPDVGDKVLCTPIESLPLCSQDVIKVQQILLEKNEYKTLIEKLDYYYIKRNVHARFFGLPVCPELHRTVFPKNVDLGCFLKVTGTVVRVTQSKMLEYQRKYVCMKCKYENCVQAEFENRYILKAPKKCSNSETRCRCSTFTQVSLVSREHCKDYQEIKIQEQVNKLSIGTIPGSMWVVLENDLVDCCKPGDDVLICGTVRRRWRPPVQTKKCEVEIVLQANYIEICNAQRSQLVSTAPDIKDCFDEFWLKYEACPLKGRDQILAAVCPQVTGLYLVKLALLLTVITGSNHIAESDTDRRTSSDDRHSDQVRGQCHLLLVGDPGTGKSQLLRAGVELTARSVFTSGAGSTRAGLTCAALREEGEWHLEAGALVLSDGGVCCIDEISQLREHDRTAIHEAMEQQTISVAKAGIVCKLNTRCAVIGACNPKGHYDTDQPLSVNVSLGTPLLSRFDLIFILLDKKNKNWDKLVSSYILFGGSNNVDKKQWSLEKLQMYISLVGPRPTKMTKSANAILQSYYMRQRKAENRDPSRTTVRMLDSLVRLSQAHCRLMYRTTILPVDAIIAVSLVDLSMQDYTLDDTVDALHSTVPRYADFEYLHLAKKLLTKLNLTEIWQEELLRYGQLLQIDHKTLGSEIERGNYQMFTKYDDVTDDNIPLSASLVTSSYFKVNIKKPDNETNIDEVKDESNEVKTEISDKLAVTLKKHATMNKKSKSPPKNKNKIQAKRKRKEVTLDTESIENKITTTKDKAAVNKKRKTCIGDGEKGDQDNIKSKRKHSKKIKWNTEDDDIFNESDADLDSEVLLEGIPSVNDIFKDLGIGLKGDVVADSIQSNQSCSKNIKIEPQESQESDELQKDPNKENHDIVKKDPNTSRLANKLKMFEHKDAIDCDKFYEGNADKKCKEVVQLNKVKENQCLDNNSKSSSKGTSAPSSQISIFESSDCDFDIDI